MAYNFNEIEKRWQQYWADHKTFKAEINHDKPKFYVLDMFPYPSGAGLHVGHPLGYIASDIFARYKRHQGYNVLHPMGYDAYGLPAEQYAIQTGTHPAITTEKNIARYRQQLDQIGFSYDWDREVRTSDPHYYKWTQWMFIQLFESWYDNKSKKAQPISLLIKTFATEGNAKVDAATDMETIFDAATWQAMTAAEQSELLMHYRLAYLAETSVNWCPALGTVLANDEVKDGLSERGGHPVEKRMMKQWLLRMTAYAQRLLDGLDSLDWSHSLKETQRNWIGRSQGASALFRIANSQEQIEVFTTRPDTLFGATYMVLAPEHPLLNTIVPAAHKKEVEAYITQAKNRSERERMAEVKKVSGVFSGAYGINPFTEEKIPIWVADYVLMGYGTGAIMAVPAHDSRDFAFAQHFQLPIIQVVQQKGETLTNPKDWDTSYDSKDGIMLHSGFLDGLSVTEAIQAATDKLVAMGIGYATINYRLRDAIFSRQRYWGEPFPVYYKEGIPHVLSSDKLPLNLPEVDKYLPTESGEPPLARAHNWTTPEGYPLETNTMPGFAGSSAYYYRYMDPSNDQRYFSKEAIDYWQEVDLYLGGDEHATGHLLYARFWSMFLYDIGMAIKPEPFKKLINQGKIQGRSSFVYRINGSNTFVSYGLRKQHATTKLHVDISMVDNDVLDTEAFKAWRAEYSDAEFILEDGKYICGWEVEKMSKSKYNVQNPDNLIEEYGADTFRLYEMFLGPIENHKPWDTKGIEGVSRFIKKFWKLYHPQDAFALSPEAATPAELKILHQTIKKVGDDIERFSLNTVVSQLMICTNTLSELKCHKQAILEPLAIVISSFAPHIAEELWAKMGHHESISTATYPKAEERYIKEDNINYPVSFNGKMRFKIALPADLSPKEIEAQVLAAEEAQKWLQDKTPKKVIVVPKRIVNIVL